MIRFPAANGNDLILFGDGGVELKNIGLNGVGNTLDFGGIDSQAGGERFPKCGGRGSFDKDGGQ